MEKFIEEHGGAIVYMILFLPVIVLLAAVLAYLSSF